jgi:hypothetical protein
MANKAASAARMKNGTMAFYGHPAAGTVLSVLKRPRELDAGIYYADGALNRN